MDNPHPLNIPSRIRRKLPVVSNELLDVDGRRWGGEEDEEVGCLSVLLETRDARGHCSILRTAVLAVGKIARTQHQERQLLHITGVIAVLHACRCTSLKEDPVYRRWRRTRIWRMHLAWRDALLDAVPVDDR
jgi:hypothetical protein